MKMIQLMLVMVMVLVMAMMAMVMMMRRDNYMSRRPEAFNESMHRSDSLQGRVGAAKTLKFSHKRRASHYTTR